ncbi:MAG: prepilin peptidase [Atopobiaceae bacterium]|nr:prepilin peptidase [Atopobiaceae bacterium]
MLFESIYIGAYCIVLTAVLGLCMGSFLNCLAWRMTHGESIMRGRSHCVDCGHPLAARDLVPVISWLVSRGRCRYCGKHVSVRYPLTEIICACGYVSILLAYGLSAETIELIAFFSVLLVLSLTDLDDYVIPNATIVAAIVIRLVYLVYGGLTGAFDLWPTLGWTLLNGVVVAVPVIILALVMDRVLGRDSLGGGDVKLLFVAGLYFGWQQCLFLLIVACIIGILFAFVGARSDMTDKVEGGEEKASRPIPFGPAIAIACWIVMLVGSRAVEWYLGLFGI